MMCKSNSRHYFFLEVYFLPFSKVFPGLINGKALMPQANLLFWVILGYLTYLNTEIILVDLTIKTLGARSAREEGKV